MKSMFHASGMTLVAVMWFSLQASAQLTYQPAAEDPFSSVTIGHFASPAIGDIDGDGDQDLFIGQYNSNTMLFYRNVGDPENPIFEEQTGDQNPLSVYWNSSGCNAPVLVDIDADGDLDVFAGVWVNIIRYFRNEGDTMIADFVYQDGNLNPLDTVYTEGVCTYPAFVDIDGDHDYDVFVTDGDGNIEFYRNTGDRYNPLFERDSTDNPLSGVVLTARAKITFEDINQDSLPDAVIGHDLAVPELLYYENVGTAEHAVFEQRTGSGNPFREITGAFALVPVFADLDDDGEDELVVGTMSDVLLYEATILSATRDQHAISMDVYPNPTSGNLWVRAEGTGVVDVMNELGARISQYAFIEEGRLDLSALPRGAYLIRVSTNDGFAVKHIVLQ